MLFSIDANAIVKRLCRDYGNFDEKEFQSAILQYNNLNRMNDARISYEQADTERKRMCESFVDEYGVTLWRKKKLGYKP